jgi:uncharacterized protein (DUF58 family)
MTKISNLLANVNKNLKFTANAIVEGFITGLHQSPYHGFSVEFSDHKSYNYGDPVDLIDWKLFSKTDRYYIKRYEEETNVRTYFLLDISKSMDFKSHGVKKIDYAKLLTACLINLSLRQRDATGLSLFNNTVQSSLPAKSKSNWLNQCLFSLEKITCSGQTNISGAVLSICERISKKSIIVIITDCIDDTTELHKALNFLKFNKHHCILFHIIDPKESTFDYSDDSEFYDIETNEMIRLSPWIIKREYLKKFAMFRMKHKDILSKLKYEYCVINTETPIEYNLNQFLLNRRKI